MVYGATFRFDKEALINELDAMTARVRQQWKKASGWPACVHAF
ncbi:hypothetical protein ACVXHB_01275 [Escherichia coli]